MTDKNQSLYISNTLLDNIVFENTITIEDTEIEVNEENLSTFDNVHLTNVFVIAPSTRMDITNSEIVDDLPIPENSTMNDSNFTIGQVDTFHMVDTDMKNISCRSDSTKDTTNQVHLSDAVLGNLQLHNTVNMEHSKIIASNKFPSIIDNVDLKNIDIKAPNTKVDIINTKLVEESPYELNTNKQFSTHIEQTPYQPIIIKDGVMFTSSPSSPNIDKEVENYTVPTNEEIVELDI